MKWHRYVIPAVAHQKAGHSKANASISKKSMLRSLLEELYIPQPQLSSREHPSHPCFSHLNYNRTAPIKEKY